MTTSTDRGSAKIYQFPVRARSVVGDRHDGAKPAASVAALSPTSLRVANATFGSAWYHEEAVQAERAGTT